MFPLSHHLAKAEWFHLFSLFSHVSPLALLIILLLLCELLPACLYFSVNELPPDECSSTDRVSLGHVKKLCQFQPCDLVFVSVKIHISLLFFHIIDQTNISFSHTHYYLSFNVTFTTLFLNTLGIPVLSELWLFKKFIYLFIYQTAAQVSTHSTSFVLIKHSQRYL